MPPKKHPRSARKEQPHDAVFKTFFSDAKIARNYLLHYTLPAIHRRIDFSFFRKSDSAFISGRFGISFCDVVYETRLTNGAPARLLFLFEHKSYIPTHPIHLQLLDYLLQIWEDDMKNKRSLSFVIPIVVYHGEQTWKQKPFSDYFQNLPEEWQAFIPNFHYLLTDLSQVPQQTIQDKRESEFLRNLFLALKMARDREMIRRNWKKIFTFGIHYDKDDRERILLQSLTLYLVHLFDMAQSEIKNLSKDLPEPERSWVDSIPEIFGERWKKAGYRAGRRKGRQEGLEEKTRDFTLKIMQKFPDWSNAEVAAFVGVTEDYVQQLRQNRTTN
ncbi:MAG: Rpn family recombination-promoting nuclease/putative transposase [Saprospirales bacterium]|nr:Rpn family recombination-promoting nuclease/putative transposase [Saprospirales bacterium]